MKSITEEFSKHLKGDVTSLSTFWVIRKKDGEVLRFTDSDEDVPIDGEIFRSTGAYSRSAIESTASLSVDNLEIEGISGELSLPKKELNAGAFNNAEVEIFMASWIPSIEGILKLRKGVFGEARVMQNGTFAVEIRGLMQKLAHTYTDVFSATCRNDLGDNICGIDLTHPFGTAGAHIPVPYLDANFEEIGSSGIIRSLAWYNDVTDETLVDSSDAYTGEYSAHGSDSEGRLIQSVELGRMDNDLLHNIDRQKVTFTGHAWRKDSGGQGRLRYEFLDAGMRSLRKHSGSYRFNSNHSLIDIPTITVIGDFTAEVWLKPDFDHTNGNFSGRIFRSYKDLNLGVKFDDIEQELRVTEDRTISYWSDEVGHFNRSYNKIEYPFDVDAETWVHIALKRNGDTFSLYLDGGLVSSIEDPDHPDHFEISSVGELHASWDEFRVWDVARTSTEISLNRFIDLPLNTPNLRTYYPFEGDTISYGTSGSQIVNESGEFRDEYTPVSVAHRGLDLNLDTGFQDVGEEWALVSFEDRELPAHTRHIRVSFDHDLSSGNPKGTRMDSLFGWFEDSENSRDMPNFEVGENPAVWKRAGMVTYGGGGRVFQASIDEPRQDNPGWFQGGLVTFYSGDNAGGSMEVKTWDNTTHEIELFLSLPYPIKQGDLFTIYPGCDKTRVGCAAFFGNVKNFFGTPDVPGEDELLAYPDSK